MTTVKTTLPKPKRKTRATEAQDRLYGKTKVNTTMGADKPSTRTDLDKRWVDDSRVEGDKWLVD